MKEHFATPGRSGEAGTTDGDQTELRLAVIGTPRSGNTWVRWLLAELYGLEQLSVHFPHEIDWENLPRRCVVQIHWYPVESFLESLQRRGVRVVVPARHPFDVLMSWLNHIYYKHADGICLGGGACTECGIVGALPGSDTFLDYVRSYSGRVLLCYSPAWWDRPGVLRVRYEDLIEAPEAAVARLAERVGGPTRVSIAEAVAAHTIQRMRSSPDVWRFHCWQGQPGLWRHLVTPEAARRIVEGVPEPFDILGYPCDPDEGLGPVQADLNWVRLQLDSTRDNLQRERMKHRHAASEAAALQEGLDAARQALKDERRSHKKTRRALAALRARRDTPHDPPAPFSPPAAGIALRVKQLAAFLGGAGRSEPPPARPYLFRPHFDSTRYASRPASDAAAFPTRETPPIGS